MFLTLHAWLTIALICGVTFVLDRLLASQPWAQRHWSTRSFRGSKHEWPVKAAVLVAFVVCSWLTLPRA